MPTLTFDKAHEWRKWRPFIWDIKVISPGGSADGQLGRVGVIYRTQLAAKGHGNTATGANLWNYLRDPRDKANTAVGHLAVTRHSGQSSCLGEIHTFLGSKGKFSDCDWPLVIMAGRVALKIVDLESWEVKIVIDISKESPMYLGEFDVINLFGVASECMAATTKRGGERDRSHLQVWRISQSGKSKNGRLRLKADEDTGFETDAIFADSAGGGRGFLVSAVVSARLERVLKVWRVSWPFAYLE